MQDASAGKTVNHLLYDIGSPKPELTRIMIIIDLYEALKEVMILLRNELKNMGDVKITPPIYYVSEH